MRRSLAIAIMLLSLSIAVNVEAAPTTNLRLEIRPAVGTELGIGTDYGQPGTTALWVQGWAAPFEAVAVRRDGQVLAYTEADGQGAISLRIWPHALGNYTFGLSSLDAAKTEVIWSWAVSQTQGEFFMPAVILPPTLILTDTSESGRITVTIKTVPYAKVTIDASSSSYDQSIEATADETGVVSMIISVSNDPAVTTSIAAWAEFLGLISEPSNAITMQGTIPEQEEEAPANPPTTEEPAQTIDTAPAPSEPSPDIARYEQRLSTRPLTDEELSKPDGWFAVPTPERPQTSVRQYVYVKVILPNEAFTIITLPPSAKIFSLQLAVFSLAGIILLFILAAFIALRASRRSPKGRIGRHLSKRRSR